MGEVKRRALLLLPRLERLLDGAGALAPEHLRVAGLVRLAGHDAVRALGALAVGGAAIAAAALGVGAADLFAHLLELGGGGLRQVQVARHRGRADDEYPARDEQGGQNTHGEIPRSASSPWAGIISAMGAEDSRGTFPGRGAARSGAPQIRGPAFVRETGVPVQQRTTGVLRCARDTSPNLIPQFQ